MDINDHSLQEIEQASKDRRANIQEKLENVNYTLDTRMQAIEDSLKKHVVESVKSIDDKTQEQMEVLKNLLLNKLDGVLQQQSDQSKLIEETSKTELKKVAENKESQDLLTNSVRNISELSGKSNKILAAHFIYPVTSCRHVANITGKYMISTAENTFPVFCEQTKFAGGWTVIQQRFDGSVDFYRNWTEYRNGFGELEGEFWLGLEKMHQMTRDKPHELIVELQDFHGNYAYARFGLFEIGSEAEMFMLKRLEIYSGIAGHSLQVSLDQRFSTFDRDNDQDNNNCAEDRQGAWWYLWCGYANLNGLYKYAADDRSAMSWYHFKHDWRGMSYSRMMIREIVN
ncbi:microfibril-associated glycoprotein 4-like [Anopheles ziemanni]|uniref:microfibril-associated glycoprotein 4-like n=1 Tax=Anopheles coustani TaxID=139045 RepID=UPI002658F5CF|nr:microfibril-associated glycoprotein 4-like [Anopheles coustani]XP_058177047.1 microfibril-associated glycoprotein 4-like [Anopheles ziemanni]